MEIGVVFPQAEIGSDPERITEFARRVEAAGYGHLLAYEHVLGVDGDREGGWDGPYDHEDQFHEPLTLFANLAGATDDIELVTGVLVLPQRQTALVAKQAAEVDVLSDGRLRLGVSVGWNPLEYVGLGQEFDRRGPRLDEQVEVLRALWTEETVRFEGEFHDLRGVGINPRPVQRPIPLWFGGMADVVLRRIARVGDGWIPRLDPGEEAESKLATLREYARAADRDPDDIGVHARIVLERDGHEAAVRTLREWADLGADYVSVSTLGQGYDPDRHAAVLETFVETAAAAGVTLR